MKHFILIIAGVLMLSVSCTGRKSSVQSDNNTDSIETVSDKQPYKFLEALDIYTTSLFAADSLPTPKSLNSHILNREQR